MYVRNLLFEAHLISIVDADQLSDPREGFEPVRLH